MSKLALINRNEKRKKLVAKFAKKRDALRGLNISITTTAKNDEEAKALLAGFRFPFKN